MLYSEGVLKGRLTLQRFVAVTATNAAKLFGIFPSKGVIQVGSDADITLWDPAKQAVLGVEGNYSKADFSIFEGWRVTGMPRMTLRRGEIVCENGRVSAAKGTGRLLARSAAA
jgi:dihydropyrimidinase